MNPHTKPSRKACLSEVLGVELHLDATWHCHAHWCLAIITQKPAHNLPYIVCAQTHSKLLLIHALGLYWLWGTWLRYGMQALSNLNEGRWLNSGHWFENVKFMNTRLHNLNLCLWRSKPVQRDQNQLESSKPNQLLLRVLGYRCWELGSRESMCLRRCNYPT